MRRAATILAFALVLATRPTWGAELAVATRGAVLAGTPLHLVLQLPETATGRLAVQVAADGEVLTSLELAAGSQEVTVPEARLASGRHRIGVAAGGAKAEVEVLALPGWVAVLPPLIAIGLALAFKEVLVSLFLGVLVGAFCLFDFSPTAAFAGTIGHFVRGALADPDNASILIFSSLLGGMVGVISKSGGTRGIVDRLTSFATDSRRGQLAAWVMGVAIFFDDYANTLIVGSTMRPITDRLRISREKLAYVVDSTAAPVASLFPISTWIGFEVGLIGNAFHDLGLGLDPYAAFLGSIPYRFYPLFALVMGFAVAFTGRDWGPMLAAERRARSTGKVLADGAVPLADYAAKELEPPERVVHKARNAVLPILAVVVMTLVGLYVTGRASVEAGSGLAWWRDLFAASDSYSALLWASLTGVVVAVVLAVFDAKLTLQESMGGLLEGFKAMILALVVLILAWSLGDVCDELHTADFLVALSQGVISPFLLPAIVFLTSAAISFATGTSWATMAILIPLVLPVSHHLSLGAGFDASSPTYYHLLLGTISSVLAGSVWGDHCSPISDTTILSSMASGCDHIAHVRTQMPYAISLGFLGMAVGDVPTAFGLPVWVSLLLGTGIIVGGIRWFARPAGK
jgi:Na+/H+ antiporter NhaC